MKADIIELLNQIEQYGKNMLQILDNGSEDVDSFGKRVCGLAQILQDLDQIIPGGIYSTYAEFFQSFHGFCIQCENAEFLIENVDDMASSLALMSECMVAIIDECEDKIKVCPCCDEEGIYQVEGESAEYVCPWCKAGSRERLMISFLEKIELKNAVCGESLLQVNPIRSIEHWIHRNCMGVTYHSADLCMERATLKAELRDMRQVKDESYDYVICTQPLKKEQDSASSMQELYRILRQCGLGICLFSLEEDEVEQFRKNGFFVHELGREYFGEEVYERNALQESVVLYLLTKRDESLEALLAARYAERKKVKLEQPLVSVLLPCYNHENYIDEAMESVLNQTYKNIEILVTDDGSSDGTPEKLLKYKNYISDLQLLETNTNTVMFPMIERAKGKYIAVMHSDDVWELDKLEMQVAYMESHPECAACFTGVTTFTDAGQRSRSGVFKQMNMSKEAWFRYFLEHGNCLAHPSILIDREVYHKLYGGSRPRAFTQLPDFWMWINLVITREIHVIEKELANFRVHEEGYNANTSARSAENMMRHMIEVNYIWYRIFKEMDNQRFKEIFLDKFINKNVCTDEQILCEKFFVLSNVCGGGLRQASIYFLYDLFLTPGVEEVLEKEYQWGRENNKLFTGEMPY